MLNEKNNVDVLYKSFEQLWNLQLNNSFTRLKKKIYYSYIS